MPLNKWRERLIEMANGNGMGLTKWIMGILATLLTASMIGMYTQVQRHETELATLQTEKIQLQIDLQEIKADVKFIVEVVTQIRIDNAARVNP